MSDKPKEAETMDAQKWVDDVEKWRAALAQPQNDAEAVKPTQSQIESAAEAVGR